MPPLIIGILLLVVFVLFGRWFATASPGRVLRTAKWAGAATLLSVGVLLALTGRLGWALAAVVGAMPWATRAWRAHALYHGLRGASRRMRGGQPAGGATSAVETTFLRMALDHDSGDMDGVILQGASQGRRLSGLTRGEFAALWRLCRGDPQSRQLLAAWVERVRPEWDEPAEEDDGAFGQAGRAAPGGMSREEAFDVLGLTAGAGVDDIKAAHRRLMTGVHPDRGGSTYLAARINQAKDVLLGS